MPSDPLSSLLAPLARWRGLFGPPTVKVPARDPLTDLMSRQAWMVEAEQASEAGEGMLVVLDLDHFKRHGERLGTKGADELLVAAAARLRGALPPTARLARLGGDEFGVLMPGADPATARHAVQVALDALRWPMTVGGTVVEVTASAGLARLTPTSRGGLGEALSTADAALYAAKDRGRDCPVLFDEGLRRIITARRQLAVTLTEVQARCEALEAEARTDALTGLPNLRVWQALAATPARSDPEGGTDLIAFVDIDHFGRYNHAHGDDAGDEALRRVAQALRATVRTGDIVVRKGGEEFVVVMPGVREVDQSAAGRRLVDAVGAMRLPHLDAPESRFLSVTVGLASGEAGLPWERLMTAAADQVMNAKVNGQRGRVHATRVILARSR